MVDEVPQRDYFPIGQAVRRRVSPTQCLVVDGGVTRRSARRRSPRDAYVIQSSRSGKEAGGRAASSGGVEYGAPSLSSRRRLVVDRRPLRRGSQRRPGEREPPQCGHDAAAAMPRSSSIRGRGVGAGRLDYAIG